MGRVKKWQKKLRLPVQEMHEIEVFSRTHLSWTEVRVSGSSKIDKVASIPLCRLKDFIKGEQNNSDANCTFVRQRLINNIHDETNAENPRNRHAIKTSMMYWCSYGCEDKRKAPPPPKRKRYFIQRRGCRCHFLVHVYECKPEIAFITYNDFNHVDSDGLPCHGLNDPSNDERSKLAPRLSQGVIEQIEKLLSQGVSIDKISDGQYLKDHFGHLLTDRDKCITRKDVLNIQRRLSKMVIEKDDKDAIIKNSYD